jgi:hypothetical protein
METRSLLMFFAKQTVMQPTVDKSLLNWRKASPSKPAIQSMFRLCVTQVQRAETACDPLWTENIGSTANSEISELEQICIRRTPFDINMLKSLMVADG